MKYAPLTPSLQDVVYPSEEFTPQQQVKVDQLVRRAQVRAHGWKELKALRLQLIETYSELIWVREQHLQLLTN